MFHHLRANRPSRKNSTKRVSSAPRRKARRANLSLEGLERRELMAVAIFQQGLSAYEGQQDTVLYSRQPSVNFGTEGSISPDQQDANGVRQGLVKFEDIFGTGVGQIPFGSTINSATLVVDVVNDSNASMQMSAYRMLVDWQESTATWDGFGAIGGIQASEGEASNLPPDAVLYDPDTTGENPATAGRFDVSKSLKAWASGSANFGWMLESASTNGWDFRTKESAQSQRPRLQVDYTAPAGPGSIGFFSTGVIAAEGDSGTSIVQLPVTRSGGVTGTVTVDYAITAGTATAGDDVVLATGTLTFLENEAVANVPVTIVGDTQLEGWETVIVTLSNPTGGATVRSGSGVETLTIGDNDALISEVLANVSNSSSDETNREYIELLGTPGASLNGYYFVVFEGEEEEGAVNFNGAGSGRADLVIDLSGQTFGSNGLLVITPTAWDYTPAAGTNQMIYAPLDAVGGLLEDSSQTYALIRSPQAPIVQGTDYDTVGAYEDATNQAIGLGLGVLDGLPVGAFVVDSVGVVEGGGGDRDRTLTPAEIGNPGIHVHQPTGVANSGGVTSDGVTRRAGQRVPNSLGAWYNGDVTNGAAVDGVLSYLNDTFFISVVAPDGSTMTPGAPNFARAVFFRVADQNVEVAESAGSVTLRIERTGDIANESVDVTYSTVDFGSATAGADFVAKTETITFAPGEAFKDVTIQINSDTVAEGFERFRVDITAVTGGYTIGDGRATLAEAINGESTVVIADGNVSTARFQNGVNGYFGTQDATIDGELTFDTFGQDTVVRVDQVKGQGEDVPIDVRPQQGLIRFDNLFGDGAGQVPVGSTIFDAFLTLNVTNIASGAEVNFFQMLQDWEEVNATWVDPQGNAGGSVLNGVTPDNVEAAAKPDGTVSNPGRAGRVQIALNTDTIQAWANGTAPNYGWSIISDLGSLWSFNSSEAFQIGTFRPELTVLYNAPTASAGRYEIARPEYSVGEAEGTAAVTIHRIGGAAGTQTVNWSVTGGTATAADYGASSGSVTFGPNEVAKTINLPIVNDIAGETNETVVLTISGAGLEFNAEKTSTTLTIRDNDFNVNSGLLLNEFWINSPGNDPPSEFVELTGPTNLPMGSLYYVAIEGLVGDREGTAEKVVYLGDARNGASGFTLITPDAADFAYEIAPGTTQVDRLGSIAQENVASQNDSTTYLLLYSPALDLTTTSFDYDWDNDGSLELPIGVQIVDALGVRVLGAEDVLYGPSSAIAAFASFDPEVDAVSRTRGNTQRNRGSAWFGGDLQPGGDDYLLYEAAESFGLPVAGAALTPGEANVGTAAQSPLVSLQSVTSNADGTLTLQFSGPVSQVLLGDQGSVGPEGTGLTITDGNGAVIPGIDVRPVVSGFFTNTFDLSFSGPGTIAGGLPAGDYRLNVVGNGLVGNGRAIDAAGTGAAAGSDAVVVITVSGLTGDYNGDGFVNSADYTVYRDTLGSTTDLRADGDNNGTIEAADYALWAANYGASGVSVAVGEFRASAISAPEPTMAEALAVEESLPAEFGFLAMPLEAIDTAFALVGDDTPAATDDRSDELLLLSTSTTAEASDSEDTVAPEREKRGARARGGDAGLGRVFRPAFRG